MAGAVLLAALALAAPLPTPAQRCGDAYAQLRGQAFWFAAADGTRLDAMVFGSGPNGVVLASESQPADLCGWLQEVPTLVRAGFRVMVFDFRGAGYSARGGTADYPADVVGAVRALARRGARRIHVVGASLGGNAALIAAPRLGRSIAGVASLSGELELPAYGPALDALAAVRRITAPLLILASAHDRYLDAADAHRMYAAARAKPKTLHVYPGSWHGWDLLYAAPYRARAQAALLAFLER